MTHFVLNLNKKEKRKKRNGVYSFSIRNSTSEQKGEFHMLSNILSRLHYKIWPFQAKHKVTENVYLTFITSMSSRGIRCGGLCVVEVAGRNIGEELVMECFFIT